MQSMPQHSTKNAQKNILPAAAQKHTHTHRRARLPLARRARDMRAAAAVLVLRLKHQRAAAKALDQRVERGARHHDGDGGRR